MYIEDIDNILYWDIFDNCSTENIKIELINKIIIFQKLTQCMKTQITNVLIKNHINNNSNKTNKIAICIAKNSNDSMKQWICRLIREQPDLKDKIQIISSAKIDISGITHVKNINESKKLVIKDNKTIIFVMANSIRFHTLIDFLIDNDSKYLENSEFIILHDETHNIKEGINPFKNIISNLIWNSKLKKYYGISAGCENIYDNNTLLWKKENIENNYFNFTKINNILSTDDCYSSIQDATMISFEELQKTPNWINYNINEIDEDIIKKVHSTDIEKMSEKEKTKFIESRVKLEWCQFMKNDKEKEAINNALNLINNINIIIGKIIINDKEFSLNIICQPKRNILTEYLAREIIKKNYNVIYKYKSTIYVNGKEYENKTNKLEINDILNHIIIEFKLQNKPLFYIGNYYTTGESLTFVNYLYGIVNLNIKLTSTTEEEDYQQLSRSCYIKYKFEENDKEWKAPTKYIIAEQKAIKNACNYEKKNDNITKNLKTKSNLDCNPKFDLSICSNASKNLEPSKFSTSIPVSLIIEDDNNPKVIELYDLVQKKNSKKEKKKILNLLEQCIQDGYILMVDKIGKLDFSKMELNGSVRCYKQEYKPDTWRFDKFKNAYDTKKPYVSEKKTISEQPNQIELLCCKDTWISSKDKSLNNSKRQWWLSYSYE